MHERREVSQAATQGGRTMRSVSDLFHLVQDGIVKTAKQGGAIIEEEVRERMALWEDGRKDENEIRAILKENIGYSTGYCDHEFADRVMEVYECEHPVFGKKHPSPEEALQMGIDYGLRRQQQRGQND
jgi:hypothetical protein